MNDPIEFHYRAPTRWDRLLRFFWSPISQRIWNSLARPERPEKNEALKNDKALVKTLKTLAVGRTSMTLRHLDCGSCNGCELQLNALANPCYDMEGYGIAFESSPRHANYLVMTGPVTRGLAGAACRTLEAMPEPGIVAVGDCAVGPEAAEDGAWFHDSYARSPRTAAYLERFVIRRIPGCPPSPARILAALAEVAKTLPVPSANRFDAHDSESRLT
jgi:Ni,Fe-hydrogenase III small subunit